MNRQEWLQWRQKGIGSSDVPIIMGVSPYATALELYETKIADTVEEDETNQFIKDVGNEIEPKIRSLYSIMTGIDFQVALMEMEGFPLRSSLDGICPNKEILIEIKLLGKEDYEGSLKGKVPERYYPQMQQQLLVSKGKVNRLIGYPYSKYKETKKIELENLSIVEVTPDIPYQETMMTECLKFWKHVTDKKPPIPSAKDYKTLRGYAAKVKYWKQLKEDADIIAEKMEQVRAEIIAAAVKANHPRFVCAGVRIRQESRAGSVNYKNIPELKGVNLDKYRGAGSVFWKMEIEE